MTAGLVRVWTVLLGAVCAVQLWGEARTDERAGAPCDTTAQGQSSWAVGVDYVTEGQWNMTHHVGAWVNRLDAGVEGRLWKGAQAEVTGMATWTVGHAPSEDDAVCQDYSNINAPTRAFRLIHAGLRQQFTSRFGIFAGLCQADEVYFVTEVASLFTGASYGCLPTMADNFEINVFPLAALGVQADCELSPRLMLRASVYNGCAAGTLREQFRFRPGADGVLHLGSLTYNTGRGGRPTPFPNIVQLGWNVGNHPAEAGRKHTQFGFWLTGEQWLGALAGWQLTGAATFSFECHDSPSAKHYWNAALAVQPPRREDVRIALGLGRACYRDAHETAIELNAQWPVARWLSVQPAIHLMRTNGREQVAALLRLNCSLP